MKLFDAHTHLQDARLLPLNEQIMRRATEADIKHLISCGTSEADWHDLANLARNNPAIHPSFGLHPWNVMQKSVDWKSSLAGFLHTFPQAGIGEVGMDFAAPENERNEQQKVFIAQLELARDFKRPVSIHCRRAWGKMLELMNAFGGFPGGFLVHSFSGSSEIVPQLVSLGGYLSFSGSITNPDNTRGPKAVSAIPDDRLLIETDAPDMLPWIHDQQTNNEANAGKVVNEPANLIHVLRRIASIRSASEEAIAAQTFENASRLFLHQ